MERNQTPEDKIKITRFFNELLGTYGAHSARGVGWGSDELQLTRFEILIEIADLNNSSILDVGCGLGDFYGYLKSKLEQFEYLGIDITNGLVRDALDKYPDGNFQLREVFDLEDNSFDFVFASGVFSYNIPDYFEKYFAIIEKMYKIARKGVAFNMLDRKNHIIDETFMAYEPEEVLARCRMITEKAHLRQGYLPQDFTLFLYK